MAASSASDQAKVVPRRHVPWWLLILALSFGAYQVLLIYANYFGPEPPGLTFDSSGGGIIVRAVSAGSPAARGGLKPGDRVVAIDGQQRRNRLDWIIVRANLEVGHPNQLQIERDNDRRAATLILGRRFATWSLEVWILATFGWATRVIVLILAFIIAFKRAHEPIAILGALFLATVASGDYLGMPSGMAPVWRALPLPVGLLLWIPLLSAIASGPLFFTFFSIFPRRLFHQRWLWLLIWTPALIQLPWVISLAARMVYRPDVSTDSLDRLLTTYMSTWVLYVVGGLTVLVVNYRRLKAANERRRLRVVVAGCLVGLLAGVPQMVALYLVPPLAAAVFSVPGIILQLVAFLAFPLSFAYAILRHRLFDIRLIVRQGLQYALARRMLLAIVPVLTAFLLLDLLLHREQSIMDAVRVRGWIYAGLAALALTAYARRRPWLEALDRRFFREPYNAQRLLREVVDELRGASQFEQVAPQATARIEAALHPEFVAILKREPRTGTYLMIATTPSDKGPPPVPADSKIIGLVRLLGKPAAVGPDQSTWLAEHLPYDEREFLRESRLELIVPVPTQDDQDVMIVLGPKRSEEPYSREDQELLAAIASSIALLLERHVGPQRQAAFSAGCTFEECPDCGKCYDPYTRYCHVDGAALLPVAFPRQIADRYRLEVRLGRGGMGTVYEASDTVLKRLVAVKVIREDILVRSHAAERFRREARALASFAHPNVVTIYDLGFATEVRPFLVMERLKGETLREELQRGKRLPVSRTLEILRGACAALDAAHSQQLIHRDLKPENIFLAQDRSGLVPKVLDFGVAKFLRPAMQPTAETATGVLVGTLRYMAPEQLRGDAPQPSWDIWALAVITYEMLIGEHPYATNDSREWRTAFIAGHWTAVGERFLKQTGQWQQFFERALAHEIVRRPASALAFLSELELASMRQKSI
jgi:tRNA A-37 threonylcarbamoyl transferase component Bud32